jgi:predicted Zn finger-like uncharacterized protein
VFVTCGNCDAEYELDDAKIPAGGARLRCTSCDHSFVVTPPEASDIRSADDLAHDSLTAERRTEGDPDSRSKPAPAASFDFDDEADDDSAFEAAMDEGFDIDPKAASDAGPEAEAEEEFEVDVEAYLDAEPEAESEEEFEVDVEVDPDPEPEAESEEEFEVDVEVDPDPEPEAESEEEFKVNAEADPDPEIEEAPEEGFDLSAEADPEPEVEAASEEETGGDGDDDAGSDFEVAPEGGFDLERAAGPDPELEGALEAASNEGLNSDSDAAWEFNEEVDSSESAVAEAGHESPFDQGDDWNDLSTAEDVVDDLLGSGASIEADAAEAVDDLLGETDPVDSQLGEPAGDLRSDSELPSRQLDLGDQPAANASDGFEDLADLDVFDQPGEGEGAPLSAATSSPSAAARDGARAAPQVGIAVAMADDSRTEVRWTDRFFAIAGWAAVCVLVAVALVSGFATNSIDASATSGRWAGAGFEADQIVGRWVDNAVAGSIYVVSGRVRRAAGSDQTPRRRLGIQLIDTKGRQIDRPPIPLAPAVPERILRESSPAELDDFQLQRAGRIAVVGEGWVSFEAVLTNLPRFAGRFELQAIDH